MHIVLEVHTTAFNECSFPWMGKNYSPRRFLLLLHFLLQAMCLQSAKTANCNNGNAMAGIHTMSKIRITMQSYSLGFPQLPVIIIGPTLLGGLLSYYSYAFEDKTIKCLILIQNSISIVYNVTIYPIMLPFILCSLS